MGSRSRWYTLLLLFGSLSLAGSAGALSFTLTADGCSGSCGSPPYGTIDVVQGVDANTVNLTVTLIDGEGFVSTGGPHHAFSFNLAGGPAVSILSLPSGFTVGATGGTQTPFGVFGYIIDCPGCGPGASNAKPGPLTFSVQFAGGLSPASFTGNAGGYYFAADIIGVNGRTGNVAARVPEPATLALLTTGIAGLAAAGRRRSA